LVAFAGGRVVAFSVCAGGLVQARSRMGRRRAVSFMVEIYAVKVFKQQDNRKVFDIDIKHFNLYYVI